MIKPEFEQRVASLQMKMLQAILETYVWGKPDPHLPTGEIYEALVRLIARLVSACRRQVKRAGICPFRL